MPFVVGSREPHAYTHTADTHPPTYTHTQIATIFRPSGERTVIMCGLSKPPHVDNSKIKKDLGLELKDPAATVVDTLNYLIKNDMVK